MKNSSLQSPNILKAAKITDEKKMFAPCMVGSLESQFLKMQTQILRAKNCLDIGTFTGMSALAMAEGLGHPQGKVYTVEFDPEVAKTAQRVFDESTVGNKIELHVGKASDYMKQLSVLIANKVLEPFDLVFIDADKENYIEYYELAVGGGLLSQNGIILADNSMCALLYDKTDVRSQKLHEFNQYVKNDNRVEQVILTVREGITMIRRKETGDPGVMGGFCANSAVATVKGKNMLVKRPSSSRFASTRVCSTSGATSNNNDDNSCLASLDGEALG